MLSHKFKLLSELDADMNMSVMVMGFYNCDDDRNLRFDMNANVITLNPLLYRLFMSDSITNAIHIGLFIRRYLVFM